MKPIYPGFISAAAVLAAVGGINPVASAQIDMNWNTFNGGGGVATGGAISIHCTIGQPDAGQSSGGAIVLRGGYWAGAAGPACYVNCDLSTTPPILNINDYICFTNRYAAADSYANCDHSTTPPVLNINDYVCFTNLYAAGCP